MRQFLDRGELEALVTGFGSETVYRNLRQRCLDNIRTFSSGLGPSELEEIVSEAISEALPSIQDNADLDSVNLEVQRALWRVKKRVQRQRVQPLELRDADTEAASIADPTQGPSAIETRDRLTRLVEQIEDLMSRAFGRLSERDQTILASEYGLELPTSDHSHPNFPSDSGRRKAKQRARQRFNQLLEGALLGAEIRAELDQVIFKDLLRIFRGGRLEEILVIQDLSGEVSSSESRSLYAKAKLALASGPGGPENHPGRHASGHSTTSGG